MDKHAFKTLENFVILSLEFYAQHKMELLFNKGAIAFPITVKLVIKILGNYAIILANLIGATLRIKRGTNTALHKMASLVLIVLLNIALLSMVTIAHLSLSRIPKELIAGQTLRKYVQQQMLHSAISQLALFVSRVMQLKHSV